jgi:hypothetical protein
VAVVRALEARTNAHGASGHGKEKIQARPHPPG